MPEGLRVLGIDPGYGRLGYGVVDRVGSRLCLVDAGVVETGPAPMPDRLKAVHDGVADLIARHRPELVGTERLFFAKNQTTVMGVAQALGCVLLAVGQAGLPWVETTPPEVKRAVTGQGNAEKRQVQFMVARLLGLAEAPKPDDAADALAVAIAVALNPPRG